MTQGNLWDFYCPGCLQKFTTVSNPGKQPVRCPLCGDVTHDKPGRLRTKEKEIHFFEVVAKESQ